LYSQTFPAVMTSAMYRAVLVWRVRGPVFTLDLPSARHIRIINWKKK